MQADVQRIGSLFAQARIATLKAVGGVVGAIVVELFKARCALTAGERQAAAVAGHEMPDRTGRDTVEIKGGGRIDGGLWSVLDILVTRTELHVQLRDVAFFEHEHTYRAAHYRRGQLLFADCGELAVLHLHADHAINARDRRMAAFDAPFVFVIQEGRADRAVGLQFLMHVVVVPHAHPHFAQARQWRSEFTGNVVAVLIERDAA